MKVKEYKNTKHYCITEDRLSCYVDIESGFNRVNFHFPHLVKGVMYGTEYSKQMIIKFANILNKIVELIPEEEKK